ncbi:P-loop containing nucleoside triphosphate hydrolase protein [Lactarius deliciosus]|nr:P-loop containing nucleoside triphosphate hydrolase protein [Lactarius deliciosus]
MGLRAKAINGKTYNNTVSKDFTQGMFQVVITSPEMCLKHPEFRKSLEDASISKRIAAFIIDEAHCITHWGDKFRDAYASIGTLHAFVPARVPFLVTSATLTPQDLTAIQKCVLMRQESTLHLNLGNDQPNIFWKVLHMEGGRSDLEVLSFLLPDKDAPVNTQKLERGLIFFDDIFLSMTAWCWFQEHLPQHLWDRVRCYNSRCGEQSKCRVLTQFDHGDVDILFASEAAGMGCDLLGINFVVQFMTPDSLGVWLQRAGRARRQSGTSAKAYLLVQPSVFQEKAVEDALREWVETESCRHDVVDKWFNNPGPREAPTEGCCDNCERNDLASKSKSRSASPAHFPDETTDNVQSTSTSHAASLVLTPQNLFDMQDSRLLGNGISPPQSPDTPMSLLFSSPPPSPVPSDQSGDNDMPSDMINRDGKRPMHEGLAQRRDEVCRQVREALFKWRDTKWEDEYSHCPWGPEGLLPDTVLTTFVSHGLWRDISDVKSSNSTAAIRWMWLDDHRQEVLDLANKVDTCVRAERTAKRQMLEAERAAARARVWEEEAQKKEADRARRQEAADAKKRLRLEEVEKRKEAAATRKLAAVMKAEEVAKKKAARTEECAAKAAAKAAKVGEIAHRKAAQELAKALEVLPLPSLTSQATATPAPVRRVRP